MKSRIALSVATLLVLCTGLYYAFSPASQQRGTAPVQAKSAGTTEVSNKANPDSQPQVSQTGSAIAGGRPIVQPADPEEPADTRGPDRLATMSAPAGGRAEATLEVEGQPVRLAQNQLGVFVPRPEVKPGAQVPIVVSFPDGAVGEKVVANVLHGGDLDGGEAVLIRSLDEKKAVRFTFTAGKSEGIYQVSIRRGAQVRTVEVWAGTPLKLAETESAR